MCVAGAIAGSAVLGAVVSSNSAGKAASAQQNAAQTASNTQMNMYNQTAQREAPWVGVGGQANNALAQFYGLPGQGGQGNVPGGGTATVDYNKLLSNLPGYQFQLGQGELAVDRNLGATGLFQSGAGAKALTQYGQGLAQNYAGQYTAGLSGLSQFGQAAASNVGSAGVNAANQIGSNQIYGGNAAASGYANQSNAFNSGLQGLVGAYGYNQMQQNQYPTSGYDSSVNSGFAGQYYPQQGLVGSPGLSPMTWNP